jgi:hypothetical protein
MVIATSSSPSLPITPQAPAVEKGSSLDTELQSALEHARRLTEMYGTGIPEVVVAWSVVEELLAEKARQRSAKRTAFEDYCATYPDAPECRMYDV